jgi:hypothetical protein
MRMPMPWTRFVLGSSRIQLCCLSAVGHCWPIVPARDDRWWLWSSSWNEDWQGKPKYSEKTCPSATLSTTNPTWPDLGANPGRRGGKPETSRLSYGTALVLPLLSFAGFSPRRPGFHSRSGHVRFVVDKMALEHVFSEYFGFPCQFSFHRLLHTHHLTSGAGTIGQILADVPSGLSFTPLQES